MGDKRLISKHDGSIPDQGKLKEEFEREKTRLETVRKQAEQAGIVRTNKALRRIQEEGMVHDIEVTLAAARTDPDAALKCRKRLLDFEIAIDEVEDAVHWPTLVSEAEQNLKSAREVVNQWGTAEDKNSFSSLEKETRGVIAAQDTDLLRQKVEQLNELELRIRLEQDSTWVALLQHLEGRKSEMRDRSQAEQLFAQGHRAIDGNDINSLKAVDRQLWALLSEQIIVDWFPEDYYRGGLAQK